MVVASTYVNFICALSLKQLSKDGY